MIDRGRFTLTLAGVGFDSHSVGLFVLRDGLERSGYRVNFLGPQSDLALICDGSAESSAVLVSNMDGHAARYLGSLPAVRSIHGGGSKLWLLGGNPTPNGTDAEVEALRDLGFDAVYPKFVSVAHVVEDLDRLLSQRRSNQTGSRSPVGAKPEAVPAPEELAISPELPGDRAFVKTQWKTGAQLGSVEDTAATLAGAPSLPSRLARARDRQETLVQLRSGVADVDGQELLFRTFRDEGVDVVSFQIDSLTRHNAYAEVEQVLAEAAQSPGKRWLNGFPAVNHGMPGIRRCVRSAHPLPVQVRHSTKDPRLLLELSLAAGVTGFEGGPICYNLPYYKDYPMAQAVSHWSYVEQLVGDLKRTHDIDIDREYFGVLTATLIPPFLAISSAVLEALFSASFGCRSFSIGYAEQGNRSQDIAAIRAIPIVAGRYLERLGHRDCQVSSVFHQFMGNFPEDPGMASHLITESARTCGASGATRVLVKSPVEAMRIPTVEDNVAALKLVQKALETGRAMPLDEAVIELELEQILLECHSVLDACLDTAADAGACIVTAVRQGLIDVPFSPNSENLGLFRAVRDGACAVRTAEAGCVPLPRETVTRDRERVERRLADEGLTLSEAVEFDAAIRTGREFPGWPLHP